MSTSTIAQAAFLGITIKDAVTAILIPIVAVFATLLLQAHQQQRERRMQILRALLTTRPLPADPSYIAAINLIPVEFNRSKKVMAAWSAYINHVRFDPAPANEAAHAEQSRIKQTKLITAIMSKLGMAYSEADIQADAYVSRGFVNRDNLYLDSLRASCETALAMRAVANALEAQTRLLQGQVGGPPPASDG